MSKPLMPKHALALAILSAGFCVGTAAQTAGSTASAPSTGGTTSATANTGSAKSTLDRGDRKFLEEAAIGGMAEVELANLAQQKASSDDVKKFAERMAQDHGKANDQLKQTASTKGVQLPTALDKKHQSEMDRLQKLSGADFDREYMKHMVSDHKKDVSEFKKEAKSAKDSDVKSFASSTLPTLEEHLKLAESTNDAVKKQKTASTSSMGSTSTSGTGASSPSMGTKKP